ncbi:MAG TPA: ribonuclease Y [Acidobacteriota bacterium]|nr:ribonuclease Y [Acidobacteriota bacterium]
MNSVVYYIIFGVFFLVLGAAITSVLYTLQKRSEIKKASSEASIILERAKQEAQRRFTEAELRGKEKLLAEEQALEKSWKQKRKDLAKIESDLEAKEEKIEGISQKLKEDKANFEQREKKHREEEERLKKLLRDAEDFSKVQKAKLEEIASMTSHEAKIELMRQMEAESRKEAARIIKKIEESARERAKNFARFILMQSIEKVLPHLPLESSVITFKLPNEEMKGRVIGREGRNIRAFERITGVDVIVDDTPEMLLLACHNPLRREIAKITLDKLVEDGRIHPARIEEFYEKACLIVEETLYEVGKEALYQLGIHNMHDKLVGSVGRLKLRSGYSAGNLLEHSMETAKISAYIGQMLGANVEHIKRAAILHEIGHVEEQTGDTNPVLLSSQLAKQYGEPQAVVNIVSNLVKQSESTLLEARILDVAEHLSVSVPGVSRDGLEKYIERLDQIEKMVHQMRGVDRVFAMKAGRDLLVYVKPKEVDDEYTMWLSKEIAEKLEQEVRFSGQIKVQVIRETRHINFAT